MSEAQKVTKISQTFVDTDSERLSFSYAEEEGERTTITADVETQTERRLVVERTEEVRVGPPPVQFSEGFEEYEEDYSETRLGIERLTGVCVGGERQRSAGRSHWEEASGSRTAVCEIERATEGGVRAESRRVRLSLTTTSQSILTQTTRTRLEVDSFPVAEVKAQREKRQMLELATETIASIEEEKRESLKRCFYEFLYSVLSAEFGLPASAKASLYVRLQSLGIPPVAWSTFLLSARYRP